MRNHNIMKRDAVIKSVAGLVGQPHKVDLKNYDLLIMVEIYQVWQLPVTSELPPTLKRNGCSRGFYSM